MDKEKILRKNFASYMKTKLLRWDFWGKKKYEKNFTNFKDEFQVNKKIFFMKLAIS